MKKLETQIEIDAPADVVWTILTDFRRYGEWNPFIKAVEGDPEVGAVLKVSLQQQEGGRAMWMRPTVVTCESNREFAWRGRLILPGIFDGEHHFSLESMGPQRTRFTHWEQFTGILVPLMSGMIDGTTRAAFERMNLALKARAEAIA